MNKGIIWPEEKISLAVSFLFSSNFDLSNNFKIVLNLWIKNPFVWCKQVLCEFCDDKLDIFYHVLKSCHTLVLSFQSKIIKWLKLIFLNNLSIFFSLFFMLTLIWRNPRMKLYWWVVHLRMLWSCLIILINVKLPIQSFQISNFQKCTFCLCISDSL